MVGFLATSLINPRFTGIYSYIRRVRGGGVIGRNGSFRISNNIIYIIYLHLLIWNCLNLDTIWHKRDCLSACARAWIEVDSWLKSILIFSQIVLVISKMTLDCTLLIVSKFACDSSIAVEKSKFLGTWCVQKCFQQQNWYCTIPEQYEFCTHVEVLFWSFVSVF